MRSSEPVLYFDGRCPLCVAEIKRLGARDARHRLAFVDIAKPGFDPAPLGVDLPALYRRFARNRHAVSRWLGYRTEAPCDGAACGSGSERAAEPTADRPAGGAARRLVVTWMYVAAIAHLLVGMAVPWVAGAPWLDAYHRVIELHFWARAAPDAARAQQVWWMSLMGATVQCASVWMLALVHLGNRVRKREVWGWLLAGLLIWAPQDMLFSLQADVSGHVAIDTAALVAMVPPLVWLWRRDAV
ncbi:DCC1-like thiol-disulfide oxidoreductase family protein [Burkholderia contaminans]|uniref:DCC1-like thiol-disulfide oxidoreductase family protein n=1 Tax=Burkholderia contaminans TaxID=488447 RepID=UPI001CF3CCAD|nr:DCC1-like thiol-disulfide oxidoreductase family protein [Burkholderia contaminans]MCA8097776.1 DCC1-like thiol-disulfide oxidoreductase family protein [Burkholderia contaminans]